MGKALAVVNLKGGVGKTAIAVNFAAYCGSIGKRTLLIDLDPQTNATFSCVPVEKWQSHARENGSVADLLGARSYSSAEGRERTARDVIIPSVFKNVDLIPSHLDLFTVDLDLAGATARETRLKRSINDVKDEYEIIVCDCPPNLTIPTQNALALCSDFVIPVSPDFLSGIGITLLVNRVRRFCRDLEHDLEFSGVVFSRVGRDSQHRDEVKSSIMRQIGEKVFPIEIKERSAVSEAAARNTPIYGLHDASAAEEFEQVSKELLKRMFP